MSSIFASAAFLARFLRTEDKRALSSLFSEALGGVDGKVMDGKVAHGKYAGNGKAGSGKVSGSSADFALSLLLSSTKPYKERFDIYLLKLY